jgi:hypothetical protein
MIKIKIVYILIHSIILFGSGHGVGFLILTDIIFISEFLDGSFHFNYVDYSNQILSTIGFFSLIGKIFIIFSLLRFNQFIKSLLSLIGIIILMYSVYLLWTYISFVGMLKISLLIITVFYLLSIGLVFKELKYNR